MSVATNPKMPVFRRSLDSFMQAFLFRACLFHAFLPQAFLFQAFLLNDDVEHQGSRAAAAWV